MNVFQLLMSVLRDANILEVEYIIHIHSRKLTRKNNKHEVVFEV
jgi:hypothetical protein